MLTQFKRFSIRFISLWRLKRKLSNLDSEIVLNSNHQSVALIDVFDLHPVAVARNLNLIGWLQRNRIRPVVFQRTWRLSRISNPRVSLFWVIYELLLTYLLYGKYEKLEVSFLDRDPHLEESPHLKDLLFDGVMRFEQKARIKDVDARVFAEHAICAVSIYKSVDKFLTKQSPCVCVSGHKTYYLRGILYRLSGLKGVGLYVGPRLNNLITKRLTPSNYNDCIDYLRKDTDYFPTFGGHAKTEPWLKSIRDSQQRVDFISPYNGRYPLLAFHCWVDDNFKGNFNIFDGHFAAALEMADWLSRRNIPFFYKFHPHNSSYGVTGYDREFERYVRDNAIRCCEVSGLSLSDLADSVSLVVTGNGNIGPEAGEQGLPFLCYADAPYFVAGQWAYCTSKETFFQRLCEHIDARLSAISSNRHNYYSLPFENSADPNFLSTSDTEFFNYKNIHSGAKWANSVLSWYFHDE